MNAGDSCNVFVFSDSRLTWFTSDIKVSWWGYYLQDGAEVSDDNPMTAEEFKGIDDGTRCFAASDVPAVYKQGKVMNYVGGMCGYKYQITNDDKNFANKFKVLKDNAVTLITSSAALALTALYVF